MLLISMLAGRETRANAVPDIFRLQKTLSYVLAIGAVVMYAVAIYLYFVPVNPPVTSADLAVPISIGLFASICTGIFSSYSVRLEETGIRFGVLSRYRVGYHDITRVVFIKGERSPRISMTTTTGKTYNLWSNVVGFDELEAGLRARCRCEFVEKE